MKGAGLSGPTLLDAYEFMNRNHYPQDDYARLRRFEVMVHLLELVSATGDQVRIYLQSLREALPEE